MKEMYVLVPKKCNVLDVETLYSGEVSFCENLNEVEELVYIDGIAKADPINSKSDSVYNGTVFKINCEMIGTVKGTYKTELNVVKG